jgi:hypothetical protein
LFLDLWKKNEKKKKCFPYSGKSVDEEVRFDFGLRSRKKKLEAELYYKIVGDGGAIVANIKLTLVGDIVPRGNTQNYEYSNLLIVINIFLSKGRVKSRNWGGNLM